MELGRTLRPVPPVLAFAGSAFLLIFAFRVLSVTARTEFPLGYDARSYFAAATAIEVGVSPYDDAGMTDIDIGGVFSKYLYTPVLAIIVLPFIDMPVDWFTGLFVAFALLSGILMAAILRRWLGWGLALFATFLFTPTWHTIYLGQINLLVGCLLLLSLHTLTTHRQYSMGIHLALASVLKLTPAFGTFLLALRGYGRTLLGWLLTIAAMMAVTLPLVGPGVWLESGFYALRQFWTFPKLVSWTGLLAHHLPGTGEVLAVILSIVLVIYTLMRIRRVPKELVLSAGIALPLILVRIVWEHHAVMGIPCLLILWRHSAGTRLVAGISWLMITAIGGLAMPLAFTMVWVLSCWPHCCDGILSRGNAALAGLVARTGTRNA